MIAKSKCACTSASAISDKQPSEYKNILWDQNAMSIVVKRLAVNMKVLDDIIMHEDIYIMAFLKSRRLGIAQKIMKKAEEMARDGSFEYIRVDTNETNLKVRSLFEKLGFVYFGSTRLENADEKLLFACYQKRL